MTDISTPIPENVLKALKAVRDSGKTNMLIRTKVIELLWEVDPGAVIWLEDHPSEYMSALAEMGEYAATHGDNE